MQTFSEWRDKGNLFPESKAEYNQIPESVQSMIERLGGET
jgi:hypothetical protein